MRLVIAGKAKDVFVYIRALALKEILDTWDKCLDETDPDWWTLWLWIKRN